MEYQIIDEEFDRILKKARKQQKMRGFATGFAMVCAVMAVVALAANQR